MAGLYVHIPFCRRACHYCNFHFSTGLQGRSPMVEALRQELHLQQDYLGGAPLASVYLGGGTPSVLETKDLVALFSTIAALHTVLPEAEITLEANPDDLTREKLADLKAYTPVNRLSIGIQSFHQHDLAWMNRAHDAQQAHQCLEWAHAAGFDNLTLDLIYGAPTTSDADWEMNVQTMLDYRVPHFSAYCLTVEEGTALAHFVKKGKSAPVDEERAARQFAHLVEASAAAGYEHYEISNFAQPNQYARHNTAYWQGDAYLGIGPSAHSFNGTSRQWNVANNVQYRDAIAAGRVPFEREYLTPAQRYNEYVMTSLRTQWGCDRQKVAALGADFLAQLDAAAAPYLSQGLLARRDQLYLLTPAGKFLADGIAADLFVT